jgi:hypothetical protein
MIIETGKITNSSQLATKFANLGKVDATDYRVDVLMDLHDHKNRTILSDHEFDDVQTLVKYAFDKTSQENYTITRTAGVRANGAHYVVYKLTFC